MGTWVTRLGTPQGGEELWGPHSVPKGQMLPWTWSWATLGVAGEGVLSLPCHHCVPTGPQWVPQLNLGGVCHQDTPTNPSQHQTNSQLYSSKSILAMKLMRVPTGPQDSQSEFGGAVSSRHPKRSISAPNQLLTLLFQSVLATKPTKNGVLSKLFSAPATRGAGWSTSGEVVVGE